MACLLPYKTQLFDQAVLTPNVHWARFQQVRPGPGYNRRIYNFMLSHVIRGEIAIHWGDGAEPLIARSGDLVLVPPAVPHRIELLAKPATHLVGVHFDFYGELDMTRDQTIVVPENRLKEERYCRVPVDGEGAPVFDRHYPDAPPDIADELAAIVKALASEEPGYELTCRGRMLLILSSLLRSRMRSGRRPPARYTEAVQSLTEAMEAGLDKRWAVAELAGLLHVSEDYCIRVFKAVTGMSPNKYLQHLRHKEAKRLLLETSLSIEEIGGSLGYDDPHTFSHAFKKWQGVPPREYRKLYPFI